MWAKAFLALTVVFAVMLGGCVDPRCVAGSGNVVSENRTIDRFDSIDLRAPCSLYLTQGTHRPLRGEAEDNILKVLATEVDDGTLIVDTVRCISPTEPVNVYVYMEEVKSLDISGSGRMIGQSVIDSDALDLTVSGSGSSDLALNVEELDTTISGSGELSLEGTCTVHSSVISGSGQIRAFDLSTERTDVTIYGSGSAQIDSSGELNVDITGSGDVYYRGDAGVSQIVSGSGRVVKREIEKKPAEACSDACSLCL